MGRDAHGIASAFGCHDERAAMRTLIVDDMYPSVGAADKHTRLAADSAGKTVAGIFSLGSRARYRSRRHQNPFELDLEDGRICIDLSMYPAGLHEP
jgi:hypothetical protein